MKTSALHSRQYSKDLKNKLSLRQAHCWRLDLGLYLKDACELHSVLSSGKFKAS